MDDFNPNFTFSFGNEPGYSSKPQAAWEFAGALKQAKAEQSRTNAQSTSLDQKIKRRLSANADMKGWKAEDKQKKREQRKASKKGGFNDLNGAKEGSEDDSDDEDVDDDSDEPLPGELDDEDSDEDEGEEEEREEEEEEDEAGPSGEDDEEGEGDEEEEEQEDPRVKAKQQQQRRQQEQERLLQQKQQRAQLAGSKRRQEEPQENGHGVQGPGVTSSDDGEDGEMSSEDEEEEVAREPHQKKSKQQQQQQQQQQKQGKQQQKGTQEKSKNELQANGNAASERQQPGASTSGKGGEASGGSAKGQKGGGGFFARTPDGTTFTATSFADLQLSRPLLKAITGLGYTTPTPIQAAVVPLALAGRDVCGSAITGSGKTAAFTLPCLERLLHRPRQIAATYVLVLTPTRELAVQVHSMITTLAQHTDISAALVVGGLSSQVQASVLRRSPEIVVATPGRLIDHLHNTQSVGLEDLAVLVLDEADRLLEMGFKEEVTEILRMAPKKRQTMLFSATFNDEVRALMALSLRQPVRLAADAAAAVPKELRQEVVRLKGAAAAHKEAVLLAMCARSFRGAPSIIFFKTKQRAHRLKILFGLLGLPMAAELHGDMTQAARLESLEMFRTKEASFLLATDVAARGLDISGVQVVINYDTPRTLETYLHRIGRTARAGAAGVAVTFVEDRDRHLLREVLRRTKANVCQRLVPAASVAQWQSKLEAAEEDVAQVISEERCAPSVHTAIREQD
ncbi:P-loop containing nucleoside triphosphate hydrolase protein [Dunaliella salina]|uniref:P-loop containing nucleoside triphosphate hydrolase protein n=1 Tax=Dunaliella salina TaxID=3046 RepID=A0ABQ7GYY5_DUNSA|nr:P-loop containing nucleoside triphosphate hydrolase protein [Dunaliella salina]|eukprot:KAF5839817.1 P-loop containing nucleoside triphosphate hydrolase protein [Dunaliella salina]